LVLLSGRIAHTQLARQISVALEKLVENA
jgi:hypothetical protein